MDKSTDADWSRNRAIRRGTSSQPFGPPPPTAKLKAGTKKTGVKKAAKKKGGAAK